MAWEVLGDAERRKAFDRTRPGRAERHRRRSCAEPAVLTIVLWQRMMPWWNGCGRACSVR